MLHKRQEGNTVGIAVVIVLIVIIVIYVAIGPGPDNQAKTSTGSTIEGDAFVPSTEFGQVGEVERGALRSDSEARAEDPGVSDEDKLRLEEEAFRPADGAEAE